MANLEDWTVDDVSSWLEDIKLGKLKETFVENEIDGGTLPFLTRNDFKELGITKLGPLKKLEMGIAKLKEDDKIMVATQDAPSVAVTDSSTIKSSGIQVYKIIGNEFNASSSPFCLKLETWLKMANIPYQTHPIDAFKIKKAPKQLVPYISYLENENDKTPKLLGDSTFIIDMLTEKYKIQMDKDLSVEQKATQMFFQRLIEEHLYWVIIHTKFLWDKGWAHSKKTFGLFLPKVSLLRPIAPTIFRKSQKKRAYGHGIGRHTHEHQVAEALKDLTAVSDYLGDNEYFMGGKAPTSIDAIVYAFLATIYFSDMDFDPLKGILEKLNDGSLVAYLKNMKSKIWSD